MVLRFRAIALCLEGAQVLYAVGLMLILITGLWDLDSEGSQRFLPILLTVQLLFSIAIFRTIHRDDLYECNAEMTQIRVFKFGLAAARAVFYGLLAATLFPFDHPLSWAPMQVVVGLWSLLTAATFGFLYLAHSRLPPRLIQEPLPTLKEVRLQLAQTSPREHPGDIAGDISCRESDEPTEVPAPEPALETPPTDAAPAQADPADQAAPADLANPPSTSRFTPAEQTLSFDA